MRSWMNTSKRIAIACSIIVALSLLACGLLPPGTKSNGTPASNVNGTAMSAAHTIVAQTMAARPTSTVIPTNTLLVPTSTLTAIPTPTRTPLPFVKLEGLREAYTIAGNLYIQGSGEQAVQLTYSGQDSTPVFSDDGNKIVFYCGSQTQLCSISADGTGERMLVSLGLLTAFGQTYNEFTEVCSLAFIPGTHKLLFNTWIYRRTGEPHPHQNYDLFLVDTDKGELKQLRAPGQGGFFLASPNGKWIAVETPGHVDVINHQGRIILRNLASHPLDVYDCNYYGYMCSLMYWRQDSRELILVQPLDLRGGGPLARTVWRYSLDDRPGVEVSPNIVTEGEALSVSPDGGWIAFSFFDIGSQDGVYLGNLREGTSQLIYQPPLNEATGFRDPAPTSYYGWSPDSVHFTVTDGADRLFMGNIRGEVTLIGQGSICGWIDGKRYLYRCGILGEVGKQEKVRVMEFPSGVSGESITFVYLKP